MSGNFEVVEINEENKKDFNIVCFTDYKVEKNTYKDKETVNVYIPVDLDSRPEGREASKPQAALNNNKYIKINGFIKKLILNIDKNEMKNACENDDVLYIVENLEKNEYNGHTYYSYKLLRKNEGRKTYIINYCNSFTHYLSLFNLKPTICNIKIINENRIELTDNKNDYIYVFLSMEELKRFNKKIYNYVNKHNKNNEFALYNFTEKTYENKPFIDFEINHLNKIILF